MISGPPASSRQRASAAPLALLGYAIFGTSKHLNVGPSSTVAALSFSTIAGLGVAAGSEEWIALTAASVEA